MKKLFLLLFIVTININLFAQMPGSKPGGSFEGGLGFASIGDQTYYQLSLAPEFAIGKFGIGLDVNLLINTKDNSFVWKEMQRGRFLRYLRWGNKGDDLYARLGILDYARLGNGTIMYLYKNSPSISDRKIGMELDYNFGKFGLETVYSDFAFQGVIGTRGYVKPLQFTALAATPVIGGLELGSSFVTDLRKFSGRTIKSNDTTLSGIKVLGFDISLPLTKFPAFSSRVYTDMNRIINFGSGIASGLEINSTLPGITIFTKVERRYANTEQYMPNYFDTFYEREYTTKAQTLDTLKSVSPGTFGVLSMGILGSLNITGAYSKMDDIPESGKLHLETSTGKIIPMITINVGYDKTKIKNTKDVFTLDERSILYLSGGYMLNSFTRIDLMYFYTFNLNKSTGKYESERRIQPRITFVFPFGG
ncbi:MAG: hypothetical protein O3A55_02445 [Bacteroidetes bacterium]|nr:hypothetical protein [Bacteroidota bacterium]